MKSKFLLTALLFTSALCMNSVQAQQKDETRKSENRSLLSVYTDKSDGSGETIIQYMEDGKRYKIRLMDSKITELFVDGKEVAKEDFGKYEPMVNKILVQIEKDREQAAKDRAQAELDREQANKDRAQAEIHRQQADKDRAQANIDREKSEKARGQMKLDREQADKDRAQMVRDREQSEKDREQAKHDREMAAIDRAHAEEERKLLDAMIDELVKDKLVESRDALTSLELDETGLYINRKEQSESLHQRYSQKYLKGKNSFYYRKSGNNRQISVE